MGKADPSQKEKERKKNDWEGGRSLEYYTWTADDMAREWIPVILVRTEPACSKGIGRLHSTVVFEPHAHHAHHVHHVCTYRGQADRQTSAFCPGE